jgi:hypothetical protein
MGAHLVTGEEVIAKDVGGEREDFTNGPEAVLKSPFEGGGAQRRGMFPTSVGRVFEGGFGGML